LPETNVEFQFFSQCDVWISVHRGLRLRHQ
jgi:hypothetical protein